MASKRINPVAKSPEEHDAEIAEQMTKLATQSGYPNVAMNLKNLAQRRRTKANVVRSKPVL